LSEIRVNYSGLIAFVIGIVSVVSGLIVTLIITRNLSSLEYGTWLLIMNLIGYVIILEPIVSYWATREIARKDESGTTAVISNGIFSCIGILVYIAILVIVVSQTDANYDLMLYALILIPVIFINRTLTAINLGFKPHIASFGLLIYSLIQIPIIILLVYYLDLDLIGVIISSFFGYTASVVLQSIYGRERLFKEFRFEFVKKWFKLSWLTLYPGVYTFVALMDVTVFVIITGSVVGVSYWGVAMVIPIIIAQAANISWAVYPKILGGNKKKFLQDNFSLLFYFAIPLAAISLTFAEIGLFILNPIYVIALPVVIFASIFVFFNMLNTTFYTILAGTEKVDVYENSGFKDFLKSKLFYLPTILLVQYVIYIAILIVSITFGMLNKFTEIELVILWSIIALVTHIPFTIYLYQLVKRDLNVSLDFLRITKFLLITIVSFGISHILVSNLVDLNQEFIYLISTVLGILLIGIFTYVTLTYLIDAKIRNIVNALIKKKYDE
jgi:O-antigen/teichoic acid export membrane protein